MSLGFETGLGAKQRRLGDGLRDGLRDGGDMLGLGLGLGLGDRLGLGQDEHGHTVLADVVEAILGSKSSKAKALITKETGRK